VIKSGEITGGFIISPMPVILARKQPRVKCDFAWQKQASKHRDRAAEKSRD